MGNNGSYTLNENRLRIELNYLERYYLIFHKNINPEMLYFSPVTNNYGIICDEGCSYIYLKLKETE